jgi:hypothetical protein
MRGSLVLLAALAACSSPPTAVVGSSGERLETIVSANHVAEGGSVQVTLAISNPTGDTLHLVLGSPVSYAMFLEPSATIAGTDPVAGQDTLALAPGARVTLPPITLVFALEQPTAPDEEAISVGPGTRPLAACTFVPGLTPGGPGFVQNCANTVSFTVTQ